VIASGTNLFVEAFSRISDHVANSMFGLAASCALVNGVVLAS
jgi:hypothetical protein